MLAAIIPALPSVHVLSRRLMQLLSRSEWHHIHWTARKQQTEGMPPGRAGGWPLARMLSQGSERSTDWTPKAWSLGLLINLQDTARHRRIAHPSSSREHRTSSRRASSWERRYNPGRPGPQSESQDPYGAVTVLTAHARAVEALRLLPQRGGHRLKPSVSTPITRLLALRCPELRAKVPAAGPADAVAVPGSVA